MSEAQERLCPEFKAYMEGMEQNMQLLVMRPTEKRLKIMIMAVKGSVDSLVEIFAINNANNNLLGVTSYKMPKSIYDDFKEHVYGILKKKCNKGVNFGRVKKRMNRHEIWGLFKGYWFHNAPKEMTKHLWVPLLTDISRYFSVEIGDKYGNNNCKRWSKWQLEEFVKYTFMKNLYEVKCQINQQSNPSGPVIQHACFKLPALQTVIHRKFDRSYGALWRIWLEKIGINGKKMRINTVIQQHVKPHAQDRWKSMLVLNDIKPDLSEFAVSAHFIDNQMNLPDYFSASSYSNEDDDVSTSNGSYRTTPTQVSMNPDDTSLITNDHDDEKTSTSQTPDNRPMANPPILTNVDIAINPIPNPSPNPSPNTNGSPDAVSIPFTMVNRAYAPSTGTSYNPSAVRSHPYGPLTQTSAPTIDINGRSSSFNPVRYYNPYYRYPYFINPRRYGYEWSPLMHQKCEKCRKCKHHCKCEDDSKNNEEVKFDVNGVDINTNCNSSSNSNTNSVVGGAANVIPTRMDNNYNPFVPYSQYQPQPLQPIQPILSQPVVMQSQNQAAFPPQLQANASINSYSSNNSSMNGSSVHTNSPSVHSNDESTQFSNISNNNNDQNANNTNNNVNDPSLMSAHSNPQILSSFTSNNNNGGDFNNYYQPQQYNYNNYNNNNNNILPIPTFPFVNNNDNYGYNNVIMNTDNNGNDNNDNQNAENGMNIDQVDNDELNRHQNGDRDNFRHSNLVPNNFPFTNVPMTNGDIQNLNNLRENVYQNDQYDQNMNFAQIQ